MRISFDRLKIESFMSIGEAEIDLKDSGYTLVTGQNRNEGDQAKSNGSGKSSIWEALVWALTGNTIRGSKDVENIYTTDGTLVELNFNIDGKLYTVIRSKNHKQYKTNLQLYVDGVNVSGKGIRDTEKILSQYLPDLDASLIGSVIVLGQGLPARFTNNSPSGRKEVLENLTKSDFMIQDLKNRIVARKTTLDEQLRKLQDANIDANSKLELTKEILEETTDALENLQPKEVYENIIQSIEIKNKELTEQKNALNIQLKSTEDDLSLISSDLQTQQNELSCVMLEIEQEYQSKLIELKSNISSIDTEIRSLNQEILQAKNIKDTCPTCGQKLPNVFVPDVTEQQARKDVLIVDKTHLEENYSLLETQKKSRQNKAQEKVNKSIRDITDRQVSIRNRGDAIKKQIDKLDYEIQLNTIESGNAQAQLVVIENQLTELQNRVESLTQDITTYISTVDINNNLINDLNERIDVVRKFDTIIKRDFRGYLLSGVIGYIDSKAKEYSNEVFGNDAVGFLLNGNNISIQYHGREYEMLSGGEKQKIDLIVQFSIRDMLCEYLNFDSSLLVLDEIFDNLDSIGCDHVIDMISHKLTNVNSIYVISHHADELNIPVDRYLTVVKDNNGVSHIKQ